MMTSMLVGVALLILVNIELILSRLVGLLRPDSKTDGVVLRGAE